MSNADWFGRVELAYSHSNPSDSAETSVDNDFATGETETHHFLVRLTNEATALAGAPSGAQDFFAGSNADLRVTAGLGLPGQVLVATSADSARAAATLEANDAVAHFEENFSVGGALFPDEQTKSTQFVRQYGLHNTGQSGGVSDADIDAPEAWDIATGSIETVVAVIDSGVDYTHPDLYLNIWINQGELPESFEASLNDVDSDGLITFRDLNDALNAAFVTDLNGSGYIDAEDLLDDPRWADGIDTDGNGFEDDLVGWDFRDEDNRPFDEHRHGTHVAGIIGATGNNGRGVTGVAWQTSMMPLRFLDENKRGDISDAIEAINYTTMMRARTEDSVNVRVSNNSWGTSGAFSQHLFDAVAGNMAEEIVFVAAAGNGNVLGIGVDNDLVPFYPASLELDNVISVAALNDRGDLASFSNFGSHSVDIAAPGVSIVSTVPGESSRSRSGTSMAAPFVSGVAALVLDRFPSASALEIRDAILVGAPNNLGFHQRISSNRTLNAFSALNASTFAPVSELIAVPEITVDGALEVVVTITYEDDKTVDRTSFDIRDIEVTREGFSETLLRPVDISTTTVNGTDAVDYRFTAPGGTWDATENGTWFVHLREGEIRDTEDSYSAPRQLGSFHVSITDPKVFFVNTTLDTTDAHTDDGVPADADGRLSLRAAIMHANTAASSTTIVLPDGTYTLTIPGPDEDASTTGDLDLTSTQGIRIIGGGAFSTTIDGQKLDRVFDVGVGVDAAISGVTLQNGNADQGGAIENSGTLAVDGAIIADNVAELAGGGIYSDGILAVTFSSIENNRTTSAIAGQGGGGLAVAGSAGDILGQTSIVDTSIVRNASSMGGGGLLSIDAVLTLTRVTVSGNTSHQRNGGGVLIQSTGALETSNVFSSTVTDNSAPNGSGGGLAIDTSTAPITLGNSIVAGNRAGISADIDGVLNSDGTNFFGQPSETLRDWRQLLPHSTDHDLIGSFQQPLDPRVGPLTRRKSGVFQHPLLSDSVALHTLNSGDRGPSNVVLDAPLGEPVRVNSEGFAASDGYYFSVTDGSHVFQDPILPTESDPWEMAVADLNSDGYSDIVTVHRPEQTLRVFFGTGDRKIRPAVTYDVGADPVAVTIADINRDDRPDLVVGTAGDDSIRVLPGVGDGTFHAAAAYSTEGGFGAVSAGDINGDGHTDLVQTDSADDTVNVLTGNSDGTFQTVRTYPTGSNVRAAVVEDFNGDARADVVTTHFSERQISVMLTDQDGSLNERVTYPTPESVRNIGTGDFNADGYKDLLITGHDSAVLFGNGDGTFDIPLSIPVDNFTGPLTVGDLNGDAVDDIAVNIWNGIDVVVSNGDGSFQPTVTIKGATSFSDVLAIGDIDGDGNSDMAVAHVHDGGVRILYGADHALFQPTFAVGGSPLGIAAADLNGDGHNDVVTANTGDDSISVLPGEGDGTFGAAVRYSVGQAPRSVLLRDLNQDGTVDIITGTSDTVSVLAGNGDGSFRAAVHSSVDRYPVAIAASDLNDDGNLDIVTANGDSGQDNNTISVLIGREDGTFAPSVNFVTGERPESMVLADIDNDGRTDAVTANSDGTISILPGNGNGTFRTATEFAIGNRPESIAAGDLNGDGYQDLVVGGLNTVTVLLNTGNGALAQSGSHAIGSWGTGIAVADLDGDGWNDVVGTSSQDERATLLLGRGDGTLSSAVHFAIGGSPTSFALTDLNGDYLLDLVSANYDLTTYDTIGYRVSALLGSPAAELYRLNDDVQNVATDLRSPPSGFSEQGESIYFTVGGQRQSPVELRSYAPVQQTGSALASYLPDGADDLPTVSFWVNEALYVRNADAVRVYTAQSGEFETRRAAFGRPGFSPTSSTGSGASWTALDSADFDDDGHTDLVVKQSGDDIRILRGSGDGTFQPAAGSWAGRPGLIADLNADTQSDLVTVNGNTLSVLLGNGDATFRTGESINVGEFDVGEFILDVTAGDINGDGLFDLFVSTVTSDLNCSFFCPGSLRVLTGDGTGKFQPGVVFLVFDSAAAIALEDLNADGRSDVVFTDAFFRGIRILISNSDGTLQDGGYFDAGGVPRSMTPGDVDGDGVVDVITVNESGPALSVLFGVGDGTFESAINYSLDIDPQISALADLDGDGYLDVVVANSWQDTVSVLRGNGDGSFQNPVTQTVGDNPRHMAIGDFNGDGLEDIITANSTDGTISVLLNEPLPLLPESMTWAAGSVFAISSGSLLEYPPDGSLARHLVIAPVTTRDGLLRRSEYDVVQVDEFEGLLLATVRLTERTGREGEIDLFLIDTVSRTAESLLLNSNTRITADTEDILVVANDVIYLTAEIVGSGIGSELLSFSRLDGLRLVADVLPGSDSSDIRNLVVQDTDAYFTALVSHIDNGTKKSVLDRELIVLDTVTGSIRSVRAGREVAESFSLLEDTLYFNSRLRFDGQELLWSYDTAANSVLPSIGAYHPAIGTITGLAYLDRNGNGQQDADEPGRAAVTIYVDTNENSRREAGEPFLVTRSDDPSTAENEAGRFTFEDLPAGAQQLREVITDGIVPTIPLTITLTVPPGETVSDVLFGARALPGIIRGTSFRDSDADGVFDPGERTNSGRIVYIDENLNGVLDPSEISVTTDSSGEFAFLDLPAEQSYQVREVLPTGVATTTSLEDATVFLPAAGTVELSLGSAPISVRGESVDGIVEGIVFNDVNSNGVQDTSELGEPGVTVFVDENGDAVRNAGEPSVVTAADGAYVIDELDGRRQVVRIELPEGFEQISPSGNSFTTSELRTVDSPIDVVTGNFDGIAGDDIAATISESNEIQFFFNNGVGEFVPGPAIELPDGAGSIAVGQFGDEGHRDGLVIGHHTSSRVTIVRPAAVAALFVTDELVTPQDVQPGGQYEQLGLAPYFVTTGRFNDDQRDDIAVVSQNNASQDFAAVAIFLNNGDGTFPLEQVLSLPKTDARLASAITAGHVIDGSSTVDIVIANTGTQNVTVLSNTGNSGGGRFEIDGHWPIDGNTPTSVQIGDLNGDGVNEIVTTNLFSDNVSILKNNGSDDFPLPTVLPAGKGPAFGRIVDIDQNGSFDIAFTNNDDDNRFGILRNHGDGTFQAAETSGVVRFPDGTLAFSLDIGQFNDDNDDGIIDERDVPDIAVSNRSNDGINGPAGGLTVGLNAIVAGAQRIDLDPDGRIATGLNFGVRSLNLSSTLIVTSAEATSSGFVFHFSEAIDDGVINLSDDSSPSDLSIVGTATGSVAGSLVFSSDATSATFISTGGPLPPDEYQITLRSDATGWVSAAGNLLDGDRDGNTGDDFTTSIIVAAPAAGTITASLPKFVRGAGQPVALTPSAGIPLTLSNGNGVAGVDVTVRYNPALLQITNFVSEVSGVGAVINVATPGIAILTMSSSAAFADVEGTLVLGHFVAFVPDDAPYSSKHVLDLTDLAIFDTAATPGEFPAVDDDGMHVTSYFGDLNGSGTYNAPDVILQQRLIAQINTGLPDFAAIDPVIIGDITGNGRLQAGDTISIQRVITQIDVANVPDLPAGITPLPANGPDPKVFIPRDLTATAGSTVTVPVQLEVTEPNGITIAGLDLVISYDPRMFTVDNIQLSGLLNNTFIMSANTAINGTIILTTSSATGTSLLPFGTIGDLLTIDFTVKSDATAAASAINLLANSGATFTALTDNNLTDLALTPAPTNTAEDTIDGLLTITSTNLMPGNVDGDGDFDTNDSFLIHLAALSGSDSQIDQAKGDSSLTAAQIRSNIRQLESGADVDGDGDYDANDSFLIHLVKLSGTDSQIDQAKGDSSLTAIEIRNNVVGLGNSGANASAHGTRTIQNAPGQINNRIPSASQTAALRGVWSPARSSRTQRELFDDHESGVIPQVAALDESDRSAEMEPAVWRSFREWIDSI